jgi:hypothetical protein
MRTEIYDVYSSEADITFIMEDTFNDDELVATECKGFYYGEPDTDSTEKYYGKLKAEF